MNVSHERHILWCLRLKIFKFEKAGLTCFSISYLFYKFNAGYYEFFPIISFAGNRENVTEIKDLTMEI